MKIRDRIEREVRVKDDELRRLLKIHSKASITELTRTYGAGKGWTTTVKSIRYAHPKASR